MRIPATVATSASAGSRAPRAAREDEPAAVSVADLRRERNDRLVLRDVGFELPAGQTLAVLGPNGAGKTTLLRILATLLRPSAGRVAVLGAELPRDAWRARGRIGLVGHEPLLYRELTVRENLELNARLHGIEPAAERRERIGRLLDRIGLGRRGDELVRNLSAGMRQRAAICRAVLHRPELLLLDEPGSHLDPAARRLAEALIGPASGLTRVLVTHELEPALEGADMALLLHADGRVAHVGPAAGLDAATARDAFAAGVVR